ncbi:MAG: hypothetical protein BHW12_06210 [Coprobacillus sp. 28_7]|nr:MAG: hypothetical protein BHW12_06210 [Coprobacillus sp. 28_7]
MEMVNMIFKQNVLKEEIIKFLIGVIGVLAIYIAIIVIGLTTEENPKLLLFGLSIIFFPILILMILIGFKYLEWYCIYDDHIEVRNIYGKKNSVFFIYIFNDGRKNNSNIFNINSCYNNKKFNLKIYKTNKLENYIINTLKFKVNGE